MHPLRRARKTYNNRMLTQEELAGLTGLSKSTIERAERGEPVSWYTQQQLCDYFGKTARELGLVSEEGERMDDEPSEQTAKQEMIAVPFAQATQREVIAPVVQSITRYQPMQTMLAGDEMSPEQQSGIWLTRGASDLASLFDEGWTLENLLESLHVVLKGVQAMPNFARRRFLQLGAAAMVGGIPMPTDKQISFEEKAQLTTALSESIVAGWKLFHTAGNAQVLAVGQAQLYLVQQSHSLLSSRDRNMFYASVYNLLGRALHFQERYEQAIDMHTNAHIAAMGSGNSLEVVQSLICQADSYQALAHHAEAIQVIEEALNVLGTSHEESRLRTKAHLLACWADNAMSMGEYTTAQRKLDDAATFIESIPLSEEFDRASWLQMAGKYSFMTGDFTKAVQYLDKALAELPPNWIVRQILILLPMAAAYTWMGDREASIATVSKAASAIRVLNAPSIDKPFVASLQGLLSAFPNDPQVSKFVVDVQHQLPTLSLTSVHA